MSVLTDLLPLSLAMSEKRFCGTFHMEEILQLLWNFRSKIDMSF
jgi:hypothetical protein